MTNNVYFTDLLNDIREFSEEIDFPEANSLIAKARAAIKKDICTQKNTAHHSQKPEIQSANQRLI